MTERVTTWPLTTQWCSLVALPEIRHKVLQIRRTPRVVVAVVVHLATLVDSILWKSGQRTVTHPLTPTVTHKSTTHQRGPLTQEAAVAAVSLVDQWVASRGTLDHRVELSDASLGPWTALLVPLAFLRYDVRGRGVAGGRVRAKRGSLRDSSATLEVTTTGVVC